MDKGGGRLRDIRLDARKGKEGMEWMGRYIGTKYRTKRNKKGVNGNNEGKKRE